MKKFTSLIFFLLFALSYSQNAPITFETGQYGENWTFSNFGNGASPLGYEKVQNPDKTGINTSQTVGKFTALSTTTDGAASWAGCESKHDTDLGTFKLNYSNCTIKIMVYKSVRSDVGIKFSVADGGSTGELKVQNTKINEWEELTFDFSEKIGQATSSAIDQIVFFMDFRDRTDQSVSYFDNVTFSKSLVAPPVVACDAILTEAQQGSFTTGYKAKFETVGTNVNISFELLDQKDGLVVGLWRETPFEDIPMTNNPVGSRIYTKTITGQTPGDVISYACKFAYADGQSVTKYIKYEVGSYCDGIKPTSPTAAAPTPTAAAPNVISLFSGGAYTDLVGTNWNPSWGQLTVYEEVLVSGNATKKYTNFDYQGVVLQTPVDASNMTKLHLDVWSPDCTALKVFLVPTTGTEKSITVNPTLSGWNSFDITLADYTNLDLKSIKELKFESVTAGTTVYLDNIYFVKEVDASMAMNAPVTFETGEHGASWAFANFDNGTGPEGYEKVANPFATGKNTSATVGKYTATVAGALWAGCKTNDIGKFTLDTKNSLVKIMVYKTVISDVALKFAVAGGGSLGEIKVKNTKINEWEELSFEFYNQIGKIESTDIVTMNISLDYQARSTENVSYFDNITFSKTSVPSPVLVCDAILTEASQGSFTTGYKAKFETVGTDVNISFELLDQKDGLVVGLWKESPFAESAMVNDPVGSKIFKAKLTDQKVGSLISYACKFAYAGGQSVTKYIKYEVGTACSGTPPVVTGPKFPLDFESGTFAFVDFDGGAATTIANPDKSGINTTATVAKMVKGAGAHWAGSKLKIASAVDFSTKKIIKVKVWSPVVGKKLLLKFEGAGAAFEKEVATTVANTWEELTFDYTGVAGVNNLNDNLVFIFDLGTAGDGSANSTYYFDGITQPGSTPPVVIGPTLPLDFESGMFAFVDFDGGAATTIANPNKSGINTTATVAKMVKGAGAHWAGSKLKMASPVDFSTKKIIKVKVWSPVAGKKLLLKFEGAGAAFEKEVATSADNTWEELTFDYTGVAGVNNLNDNMIFIFDLGTVGDGSANSTYYFDEITQPGSTPPVVTGPTLPLDFESGTFAFVDFDGGAVTTIANPNKTGINTTATVAKMVKGAGAQWAGSKLKMASAVDFSTKKIIKVKVWSPVAGKKLLLKFEGAGAAFEKEVATSAANTWEELTFDYTGVAGVNNLNDNLVFIFDLGTVGDGSANSTYYFDEITQPGSIPPVVTGPTLPLDFESGTFAFVDFDGGAATTIANPNKTGINTTATVAKMVKGAGQPWGGSKLTLASPVDFSTKKIFKVKVWSPVAGKKLLLKFESPNGNFEKESVGVTAANTWEELTFDFTNVSTTNTASDMVFIFDLGTAGDGSANSTYLFDEITQSAGSVAVTGATLPLDFEAATYAFVDFDGGVTTKVANPQSNGINTSANVAKMVKGAGAMWAGSKIKMAAPVDFTTNKLFKVKVWSPVAGKKLLLKFEGTAGNFEQESTGVTAVNTWEELTFDFTKVGTNNVADFMVFIFDFGTVGDGSANSTYLFDDVKQASIPVAPSTNYLVSFETGSVIGTWDSFENPGQTGFEFANNPSKTGINTSDKVGKFTAVPTGQRWAGCETTGGSIGTWELDATSTTVTMMVYKSVISPVGIKMATSYNGTTFEIKKNNTKINEWELMTFDISPFITSGDATQINKFVVFPDFRSDTDPVRSSDVVLYFDDIKFSAKKLFDPNYVPPTVENPTVAATKPPVRNAADVKSIFSDAYAVYKEGNWCQCWGQSTVVSDVVIVTGDKARKLENFTYQGITLPDGEVFNVLDMNKVHIDIWFNDAKSVNLALVQQTPGGSVEAALKFTPTQTGWNSFDLDLNSTTVPGVDLFKVFQMKLTSEKQGSNVFLDNFYFWKDASTVLAQMDLPVTFDDATVDYSLIGFGGTEGSSIITDPTLATNKVAKVLKPAVSETWAGITISAASGLGFKNKIPFSSSVTKMSVRIWSPDAGTIVRLKVEDHADKNRTVETESTVTTAKGWETVEFDFAKPVSGTAALNLAYTYDKSTIFFGFGTTGTEKIYYFDDVKMVEVALEPILSYGVASQTYLVGKAIYPLAIINSGGLVPASGYSISPALPAGLSFDTTTAVISGTPSALSQATTFTVTGTNSSGTGNATISIDVVRELKSNNFTIKTIGETCLGENNGEIRITASTTNVYVAVINNKSYEFTTNSLRVFNLTPGTYTISISVKGETTSQSFVAVIPKGSTITGKTSKFSHNKLTVVMTEGTAPYKVYLDGVEQFETPFSTFTVDVNKDSLLEVTTAKNCEGTYTKNIDGILDASAVFPNPTSGSFEIAIPTNRKEVVVDLYSLNSVFISSKTYPLQNGTVRLSLEGQTDGIYIAKVYLDTPSYLKIIKK